MSGERSEHETGVKEENCSDGAMDCDKCEDEMPKTSENEAQCIGEAVTFVYDGAENFVVGGYCIIGGVAYVVQSVRDVDDLQHVEEDAHLMDNDVQQVEEDVQLVDEDVRQVEGDVRQVVEDVHLVDDDILQVEEEFMFADREVQFANREVRYDDEVRYADDEIRSIDDDVRSIDEDIWYDEKVQCVEGEIECLNMEIPNVEEAAQYLNTANANADEAANNFNTGIVDKIAQSLNEGLKDTIEKETKFFRKRTHDSSNGIQRPQNRFIESTTSVDVNNKIQNMSMEILNIDQTAQNNMADTDENKRLQYKNMKNPSVHKAAQYLNMVNPKIEEAAKDTIDKTLKCLDVEIKEKIGKETRFFTKRTHDGSSGIQSPKKRLIEVATRVDVNNVLQNMHMGIPNVNEAAHNLKIEVKDANKGFQSMDMGNSSIKKAVQNLNMENKNVDEAFQYLNMRNPNVKDAAKSFNMKMRTKAQIEREVQLHSRIHENKRIKSPKIRCCDIAKSIEYAVEKAGIGSAREELPLVEVVNAMKVKFNVNAMQAKLVEKAKFVEKIVKLRVAMKTEFVEEEIVEVENAYGKVENAEVEVENAEVEVENAEVEVENAYVEMGVAEVVIGNEEESFQESKGVKEDIELKEEFILKENIEVEELIEVKDAESELEDFFGTIIVFFNWKLLYDDLFMEFGCGCGHTSVNILKYFYTLKKLIAIDPCKSEIKLAKRINRQYRIKYKHRDILNTMSFEKYFNKISKVVSINCFQMFKSERFAFETIQKVLKPGGEAALLFCVQSTYFDWVINIYSLRKWRQFLNLTDIIIPFSHIFGCGEKYYEKCLKNLGFKVIYLSKEEKVHTYKSDAECKEALLYYIFPLCLEIPRTLVDEFEEECFQLFLQNNDRNSENKLSLRYSTITALFRKPKKP